MSKKAKNIKHKIQKNYARFLKYIKSTTKKVKKLQNFIFYLHTCKYIFVKKSKKVKKNPLHNLKKGTIKINTSKIVDDNNDNKK